MSEQTDYEHNGILFSLKKGENSDTQLGDLTFMRCLEESFYGNRKKKHGYQETRESKKQGVFDGFRGLSQLFFLKFMIKAFAFSTDMKFFLKFLR